MKNEAFGEVIASDSQVLEVECHCLYGAPAFGSFVRAQCIGSGYEHYAVVTRVSTGPFDGTRVVQAHRLPPGELEQRKPHLTSVLRTLFQARLVGYGKEGVRVVGTAPSPPRLHCYVFPASVDEIRMLTEAPSFLRPLTQTPDVPLEELLVAAIERAREAWESDERLVPWGKFLARLLHKDYVTLEAVLQRLRPAAPAPRLITPSRWEAPLTVAGSPLPNGADPFED